MYFSAPGDTSMQILDNFLAVYKEEPEHWSVTVDKKVNIECYFIIFDLHYNRQNVIIVVNRCWLQSKQ